jgi:hypothetical protein
MQDLIMYHDPGCGGDFLTNLLQQTGDFYARCIFRPPDNAGKVTAYPTKPEVQALFPDPEYEGGVNAWGKRKWDDWDEEKIKSCTDKTWILNTMRIKNVKKLREKGCKWPVLRISYDKNMHWFIKKCVLKKIIRPPFWEHTLGDKIDYYMFEKGVLPQYYLKKHLGTPKEVTILMKGSKDKVWKKDPPKWDIPVDNMLAKDFTPLADFNPSRFNPDTIDLWVNAQEPMFTKRPKLPKEVEKLFGYNKCQAPIDYACPLDEFDNIVIKFSYPDAPNFNNTQELFTYF